MKSSVKRSIKGSIKVSINGSSLAAPVFTVSDQTFDYGALSADQAGAYTVVPDSGTITSITIDSGDAGGNYETSGATIRTAVGSTVPSVVLSCTATFDDLSTATFTATITSVPSAYSVASSAEGAAIDGTAADNTEIICRTIGSYDGTWDVACGGLTTGTLTIRGESASSKADIKSLYIFNVGTATANLTLKWLKFDDPLADGNTFGISYDRPGSTLSIIECDGTGPFTPDVNTDRTYWAAVDYVNGTGVPVVGRTLTGGTDSAEILDVDDNGDGTGTVWVSDLSSETSENWTLAQTLTESTSGNTFNVAVTKYGGLPDAQKATAIQSAGGVSDWDEIIIQDCSFSNYTSGVYCEANNNISITDTAVTNFYYDSYKVIPNTVSTPPSSTQSNISAIGCYSSERDRGNPHSDGVQYQAVGLTASWTSILIQNSKFILGDTRGSGLQPIFLDDMPSPYYFGGDIRNNLVITKDALNAIYVHRASNFGIHNNTVVHYDPSNASGDASTISIRVVVDGGGNIAKNNVADRFDISSFILQNNVELGKGGATISYATAFDPDVFSPPAGLSEALTQYTPEPSGPLLAGATYVTGDVGCVDSSSLFVVWNSNSIIKEPEAFDVGDWAIIDDLTGTSFTFDINSLPYNGGATITDIEYRLDGGSAVSSGGIVDFQATGLTENQTYASQIRPVNSVGAGPWSTSKNGTPTTGGPYAQSFIDNNATGYLTSGDTGVSDSEYLTFNCSFIMDSNKTYSLYECNNRTKIRIVGQTLSVAILSTAATTLYEATYSSIPTASTQHLHVEADLTAGTPYVKVALNGSVLTMTTEPTPATAGTIDHTRGTHNILSGAAASAIFNGKITDYFVDFTQAIPVGSFYSAGPLNIANVGTPGIFLGNGYTAANANAGVNGGSTGTLTVGSATFTDLP